MICELLIIWGFVCFFAIGYAVGKRSAISDKIKHELEELKSVWKETVTKMNNVIIEDTSGSYNVKTWCEIPKFEE